MADFIKLRENNSGHIIDDYSPEIVLKILNYLNLSEFSRLSGGISNYYSEKHQCYMRSSVAAYNDGKYSWNTDVFFAIRDGIIPLPNEFVNRIIRYYKNNPNAQLTDDVLYDGLIPSIGADMSRKEIIEIVDKWGDRIFPNGIPVLFLNKGTGEVASYYPDRDPKFKIETL